MNSSEEKLLLGKRIGVVTPYDSNNYGAYLQAFATKTVLEEAGADVAYLRFRSDVSRRALFYRDRPSKKELLNIGSFVVARDEGKRKYNAFLEAWGRFETESMADFITRDAYVLGSDEIWNVKHPVFRNNPVFFGYGLHGAISYAPSVGKASAVEIKANPKCVQGMRSLRDVLVRDEKSADVVEEVTGKRPDVVLDPTLLLNWENVAESSLKINGSYILVYAYNSKNLPIDAIKSFAAAKGLKLVSVGFALDFCDEVVTPDPLGFYSLMKGAEYVFTTTFHGTIFALLAHSRFLSFPTSQKTEHLLATFGLGARGIAPSAIDSNTAIEEKMSALIDYARFEEERRVRSRVSVDLLLGHLEKAVVPHPDRNMIDGVVKSGMCTGCHACLNSCAKGAISMMEDEGGALVPIVDEEKCVFCGRCDKVCPTLNPVRKYEPVMCYAAWAAGGALSPLSSSGGIGYLLAKETVEAGGVSFGAVDDGGEIKHMGADRVADCQAFCGSKYTQSEIGGIYAEAREALLSEKPVLFVGTPCQVAGLRTYLGREYDDLLAVDLICHGTPPQKLLIEHRDYLLGKRAKVDKIGFRSPDGYVLTFSQGNDLLYSKGVYEDTYLYCFMKGLDFRESCYECPYAQGERVGDLTIGDFWGLERSTLDIAYDGRISVVTANTKKGLDAVKALRGLHLEERDIMEARAGNPQLRRPSFRKDSYYEFRGLLATKNFDEAFRASSEWKNFKRDSFKESRAWRLLRSLKKKVTRR